MGEGTKVESHGADIQVLQLRCANLEVALRHTLNALDKVIDKLVGQMAFTPNQAREIAAMYELATHKLEASKLTGTGKL